MSRGIEFQYNTLKLPCRFEELQINSRIGSYKISKVLSIDNQKSVFLLEPSAVLCVRHNHHRLPSDLAHALQNGVSGLVRIVEVGTIHNHWYTIDQKLSPLPDWSQIDDHQRLKYVKQMIQSINSLHNLGYCHLDIKPEHFGIDANDDVRLLDLDSALPYTSTINESSHIEYTPEYAAPEILEGKYSTASDYYALGKSLQQWGNLNPDILYLNWKKVIKKLLISDYSSRFNYLQLLQLLENTTVDPITGPRSYKSGIALGNKTAFSDKQLALLLSRNYSEAEHYIQHGNAIYPGNTSAEKIARLIYKLDSSQSLWWKGINFSSTNEIAQSLSSQFPQINSSMCELLRSGFLLEFNAITSTDPSIVSLLQNARENPEKYYWDVSRAFGGRFPIEENSLISITNLSAKVNELNSLINSCLHHGDPVTVASVLERIKDYPNHQDIDSVITRLRAIPINNANTNLTNINVRNAFGKYIETRLPEPGHHSDSTSISELYSADTLYLISQAAFDQWKSTNQTQRELRHQRNVSIGKAIGWTALGLAFLAILPYILAALAIIAVIVIILSIL